MVQQHRRIKTGHAGWSNFKQFYINDLKQLDEDSLLEGPTKHQVHTGLEILHHTRLQDIKTCLEHQEAGLNHLDSALSVMSSHPPTPTIQYQPLALTPIICHPTGAPQVLLNNGSTIVGHTASVIPTIALSAAVNMRDIRVQQPSAIEWGDPKLTSQSG